MLNQIGRINSGFLFSLAKILLFLAAFSFWAASPAVAEEAGPDPKTAPCKGLKPYNNLDELLYQFYINLDSECLFEMPLEDLEKIWDTKIFSYDRLREGVYLPYDRLEEIRKIPGFYNKPYKTEKDAFYIEHSNWIHVAFSIVITKEYYEKYATLFPDGNLPKLLPEPIIKPTGQMTFNRVPKSIPLEPQITPQYPPWEYFCYWLNSDKTRIIRLMGDYGVTRIYIWKWNPNNEKTLKPTNPGGKHDLGSKN